MKKYGDELNRIWENFLSDQQNLTMQGQDAAAGRTEHIEQDDEESCEEQQGNSFETALTTILDDINKIKLAADNGAEVPEWAHYKLAVAAASIADVANTLFHSAAQDDDIEVEVNTIEIGGPADGTIMFQ